MPWHSRRVIRTLVWNADDLVDVYASPYRAGKPFPYMEIPRDQRGFMNADKVVGDDKSIGVATSRGCSYHFRQMLSLCVIDVDWSKPGTEIKLIRGEPGEPQKEIRALVAAAPYKNDNPKSTSPACKLYRGEHSQFLERKGWRKRIRFPTRSSSASSPCWRSRCLWCA